MKTKNTKANVLVYSLVLVNLSLLLALAMFNNFFVFLNNTERGSIDKKLSANILYKWGLFAKYVRTLNSNGSGIIDNIWCPTNVSMSGNTLISSSSTSMQHLDGAIYCGWTHAGLPYYLVFNREFTGFSWAIYQGDPLNLISGIGARDFVDGDSTLIDINPGLPTSPDGIDDNFNSDNYRVSATGSVIFPWWYYDDDTVPRVSIYWYVSPDSEYSSILWSNDRVLRYIEDNPNNNDAIFQKLWTVGSGSLYLDADRDFNFKILQLDKNSYNTTKEIIVQSKVETKGVRGSKWYIQNNAWVLSLTWAITGNEYIFDFSTNDYALFVNNTWSWVLTYVLTGFWDTGSWVYLNSIDDSWAWSIKYLWSEIIQDADWNYIGKIFETAHKK